jgi:hypothetical protein
MLIVRDELPNRSDKNNTAIETNQALITRRLPFFL